MSEIKEPHHDFVYRRIETCFEPCSCDGDKERCMYAEQTKKYMIIKDTTIHPSITKTSASCGVCAGSSHIGCGRRKVVEPSLATVNISDFLHQLAERTHLDLDHVQQTKPVTTTTFLPWRAFQGLGIVPPAIASRLRLEENPLSARIVEAHVRSASTTGR